MVIGGLFGCLKWMPTPPFCVAFSTDPSVETFGQAVSISASVSVLERINLLLMPGMESLTPALQTSGARLYVSIAHFF